jgi:hypothetical protein
MAVTIVIIYGKTIKQVIVKPPRSQIYNDLTIPMFFNSSWMKSI